MLSITPSRRKIIARKDEELYALVSLQTPALSTIKKRAPLNIAVALDVSPSMEENTTLNPTAECPRGTNSIYRYDQTKLSRLDVAKFTLRKLVEQLTYDDTLSLVTFHGSATTVMRTASMTSSGKLEAVRAADRVAIGSSTNVGEGLYEALRSMRSGHRAKNGIDRVLLLTDGETNRGHTKAGEMQNEMRRQFTDLNDVGISTFGFGESYNAELLSSIVRGGGAHYYIDNAERIPTAFGTEFGTLASMYAENVIFDIIPSDKVQIAEVLNDLKVTTTDGVTHVEAGHILAEQKFHIVVRLKTQKRVRTLAKPVELLRATVRFTDVLTRGAVTLPTIVADAEMVTAAAADKIDNPDVMKIVAEQEAARATKLAQEAADRGDMMSARTHLSDSATRSRTLGRQDLEFVSKGLMSDGYTTESQYRTSGNRMTKGTRTLLARQSASGQSGQKVGGVDLSATFANTAQKVGAAMFSIVVDKTVDDMPKLEDMLTDSVR